MDQITLFITSEIDSKKNNITYIDLPISEHMTSSVEALKAFAQYDYDKAYTLDKRFSLAYLEEAKKIMSENKGRLEAQDVIDKAFVLKSKLPLQKQLEVLIQKNLAYGNYEEAEKQVKLQLEVDPNNRFYNTVLFSLFGESKNTEAYFEVCERLFNNNRSSYNGNNLIKAAMVAGYEDELLKALKTFEVIDPFLKYLKIQPLVFSGNTEEARQLVDEYKLSYTERNRLIPYDSIFNYLKEKDIEDLKLNGFVGKYRSSNSEQTTEFWLENDRLIEYVKNQPMKAHLPAGNDAIGGGNIHDYTYYTKLLRQKDGSSFGLMKSLYYWNSTSRTLFWKMDETLQKAQTAFENKDYDKAFILYKKASEDHPNHVYVDNILKHLEFKSQNDSLSTIQLFKKHEGFYGPRKFWVENSKFYYKRQEEDVNLPKVELLPINDTLFMDLTRLGTLMAFTNEDGKTLSKSYSLDMDKLTWFIREEKLNVIEKTQE